MLYEQVREESERYIAATEATQSWNGTEPALQLLLGTPVDTTPLPQYSESAVFLHPHHCRLCLQHVQNLEEHLRDAHPDISTLSAYRRVVLQKTAAEWPQRISPQVLRTCLAAFKMEMCDATYAMSVCASCARQKRRCKLQPVTFVSPHSEACPSWLPWDAETWRENRVQWYRLLDEI